MFTEWPGEVTIQDIINMQDYKLAKTATSYPITLVWYPVNKRRTFSVSSWGIPLGDDNILATGRGSSPSKLVDASRLPGTGASTPVWNSDDGHPVIRVDDEDLPSLADLSADIDAHRAEIEAHRNAPTVESDTEASAPQTKAKGKAKGKEKRGHKRAVSTAIPRGERPNGKEDSAVQDDSDSDDEVVASVSRFGRTRKATTKAAK